MSHLEIISQELGLSEKYVKNVMELLAEGSTVPFIARYRKEMTGTMDEVAIGNIKDWVEKLTELDKRRESILKTIAEQGKLTPELKAKIEKAWTMTELEDLYLPYKVKRKTRATKAREAGLEPLADLIFKQFEKDPESRAEQFLNDTIISVDAALEGARDIIAEWVSEDTRARDKIRACFKKDGMMSCSMVKGKEKEGEKYRDYFDFQKKITFLQSHQWLAIRRAENEGFIRVDMMPEEATTVEQLNRLFVRGYGECSHQVELAVKDSYKRLLQPQIETEFRAAGKELADNEAIRVFGENVRQLLLDAPVGEKRVLALDPGFRSGCKLVILNEAGDLLHNEAIYPHPPQHDTMGAANTVQKLVQKYDIEVFAVGNGTAGRETQDFLKSVRLEKKIPIFMVNESGASIYSASEVAREEFPNEDITVRGAVSIGRRLKDPLAELVKIDPKSIGVGQYQHDVDQKKLNENLDSTVVSCVNKVGVNLNTASKHLLAYVSGLGPVLAQNIVKYRSENGFFKSKSELKKVTRLGDKAYEQCAGFLRVRGAANPLDASGIHPESYPIVNQMAKDLGCSVKDLMGSTELRKQIVVQKYASATVGMPTLMDIMKEFETPGQDPRSEPKEFSFDSSIRDIKDIAEGMMLTGIITNITDFGAFVDIGIKQNGLIHKSQMANRFVKDPAEVVRLGQNVTARVVGIDLERGRVQLSLKDN